MKLNLGCGRNHKDGYVNVDKEPATNPDRMVDLEEFPWPFDDDSIDEIRMSHVLEHLGQETDVFLGIMKEIYRVCAADAEVTIIVPHPRHDDFLSDPSHVRPILLDTMLLFSKEKNRQWERDGAANTPFATYLNVDFDAKSVDYHLDTVWEKKMNMEGLSKEARKEMVAEAMRFHNNVVKQITIVLRAVKS